MHEVALEDALAEVLSSSRELLEVSRARCYVMNPTGEFRLAGSYGFLSRSGPEDVLEPGHPLIEWVQRHRRPALINSLGEAGTLREMMERERYVRCLTAPIYDRSRLIGILELQEKLSGAPFEAEDISRAAGVVKRVQAILGEFHDISVAEPEPMAQEDREALFLGSRSRPLMQFPQAPDFFTSAQAPPALDFSSTAAAGGRSTSGTVRRAEPASREVLVFQGFANALLRNPEIEAVVLSVWTPEKADLHVGARRPLAASGREALLRNLEGALLSVSPGRVVAREKVFHVEFPVGSSAGEIREPAGVQTSVISSDRATLLFSLVFSRPPTLSSERALKETHRLVRAAILQVHGAERYRAAYRSLVHFLLEPDRRSFPQLKAHSLAVASLCRRLAGVLRLPAETVEQVTVAGLLHDIGLKDLEIPYERISGRRPLDLQELDLVRQHPTLGASLLSRIEFPYEVGSLVRHHHERFDGAGYPDRLAGDRIPLGSRVIAIAEAYDAMVSAHSYRSPISEHDALEIIVLKGGTQFDPELVKRFSELFRRGSPGEGLSHRAP